MASTYSDLLRIEKQATGENSNTWGTRWNAYTAEFLEDAIAGMATVAVTVADVTLSANNAATDQARMAIIKANDTLTGNRAIIVPTSTKRYLIWNATSGSYTLTVKTTAGTGVVVQQGTVAEVFCDGTNVVAANASNKKIFIPAAAMSALSTNGASAAVVAMTAGRPELVVYDFDGATAESVQFSFPFPEDWNLSTVTFKVYWTSSATDTDAVVWELSGVAFADGDAIDTAYGTAIEVTDAAQSTANDMYISAESSAVTIAGSPTAGEMVYFKLSRDAVNGSDTMSEDARLIGVSISYGINAGGKQ